MAEDGTASMAASPVPLTSWAYGVQRIRSHLSVVRHGEISRTILHPAARHVADVRGKHELPGGAASPPERPEGPDAGEGIGGWDAAP